MGLKVLLTLYFDIALPFFGFAVEAFEGFEVLDVKLILLVTHGIGSRARNCILKEGKS